MTAARDVTGRANDRNNAHGVGQAAGRKRLGARRASACTEKAVLAPQLTWHAVEVRSVVVPLRRPIVSKAGGHLE